MKEGGPEEIDGIDVTNVPAEDQEYFVGQVRQAKGAEYAIKTSAGAAKIFGKEKAAEMTERAEKERLDALDTARYNVVHRQEVDVEAAHAEMERALLKKQEESAEQEAIVKDIKEKLG